MSESHPFAALIDRVLLSEPLTARRLGSKCAGDGSAANPETGQPWERMTEAELIAVFEGLGCPSVPRDTP